MKAYLLVGIVLLPGFVAAASNDCRVVETPERFEVVCTGVPGAKENQAPVEVAVTPVQGKHRPPPRSMDEERSARLRQIQDQRLPTAPPVTALQQPNRQ